MKHLLVLLLALPVLSGADVSGKWSGKWKMPNGGEEPHYMVLAQEGGKVTGTAGPSADTQWEIRNGKVTGEVLTFDVSPRPEQVMQFEFKVDGDKAAGQAKVEFRERSMTLPLTAERVK